MDKYLNRKEENRIVSSHDIHLNSEYAEWIAEVKHRYRSAQAKAAVKVNAEKLLWNWEMGRDLVQKKAEERWGADVVEQVSLDLQKEFPNVEGFSASNLWRMKQWFLFYSSEPEKLARGVREIIQRPVGDFPLPFPSLCLRCQFGILKGYFKNKVLTFTERRRLGINAFFLRIRTMSCTLLIILIMPRVITKARPVAAIGREYSANQRRILVCTWNVKSGTSAGVERMKTIVTAPLMIPTTKAAIIAIL